MAYAAPQSVITLAEYDQLRALIADHIDAHRAHARASIDLAMDESQAEIIWDRLRATADELVWYLTDLLSQEDQRRLRERQSRSEERRVGKECGCRSVAGDEARTE